MSRFWERRWYEGEGGALLGVPLRVAAAGYGIGVAVRSRFYRPLAIEGATVVSVGNLNVGGAGKTPVTIFLANWAVRSGRRVAVLSRGYGRASRADVRFDANNLLSWSEVGDEPRLIAQRCPNVTVWVGRDRAALAVRARDAGSDFLLLDDGMQHRRLARQADIAVVDRAIGFGNGLLLPAGPLREPLSELGRATLVWVRDTGPAAAGLDARLSAVARQAVSRPVPRGDVKDRPVVALAGLARTRGFIATLTALGANVVAERFFPDHHPFTSGELDEVSRTARQSGAVVATTEKDAQRLPAGFDAVQVRLDEELVSGREAVAEHLGLS